MRDLSIWSINLGRWWGVHLRLHAFFPALAVADLFLCTVNPRQGLLPYGMALYAILLVSVLLHEIGHAVAARWFGGQLDQIVLWPLGGLAPPQVPREVQYELATTVAGPLVNLIVCALVAPLVLFLDREQELIGLLSLLNPHGLRGGAAWIVGLKLTFWVNWVLAWINLIPAFPLDGGRAAQSIVRHWFNHRTAGQAVSYFGKYAGAPVLCIMAVGSWDETLTNYLVLPEWVAFASLAIVLFFGAKQEMARLDEAEMEDEMFGSGSYDFSQGYTSLERHFDRPRRETGPSSLRRWLANRQEARQRRQKTIEEEEERRVDEILMRLHEGGMTGLSSKDRALLDRVSARYRNRQGS